MFKVYYPLLVTNTYLIGTVLLYIYGPWIWKSENFLLNIIFLFGCILTFSIGYISGIICTQKIKYKNLEEIDKEKIRKIFNYSVVLQLLLIIPTIYARTGNIDIMGIFFSTQGEIYRKSLLFRNEQSGSIIEYIRIVLGPFLFMTIPMVIRYFKILKKYQKILTIIYLLLFIVLSLKTGTDKEIGDIIIFLIGFIIIYFVENKVSLKRKLTFVFGALSFAVPAFLLFTERKLSRGAPILTDGINMVDTNNVLIRFFSRGLKNGIIVLSSYLTQGYYANSLVIGEKFSSTYGFGHSLFLLSNLKRRISPELYSILFESSYLNIATQKGWDYMSKWHSIYVWIASDIGFIGCLFFMFFIGFLFSISFVILIKKNEILSLLVFNLMLILIFYIPANNQLFLSPESFVTSNVILLVFIIRQLIKILKTTKK